MWQCRQKQNKTTQTTDEDNSNERMRSRKKERKSICERQQYQIVYWWWLIWTYTVQKRWIHESDEAHFQTRPTIESCIFVTARVYFIYSLNRLNRFATIIRLLLLFSWLDFVEMAMNHTETVNTLNSLRSQHSTLSANNKNEAAKKRELFNFYSVMRRFSLILQNSHFTSAKHLFIWFPCLPSLLSNNNNIYNFSVELILVT